MNLEQIDIDSLSRAELLDILSWYHASGVDEAIADDSVNHFADVAPIAELPEQARSATPVQMPQSAPNFDGMRQPKTTKKPPLKPQNQVNQTRAGQSRANQSRLATNLRAGQINHQKSIDEATNLAKGVTNLAELDQALQKFDGCSLKHTAKYMIFGQGNENADLMIIGDAPMREEDISGLAFSGAHGELLDRILAAIKTAREDVRLSYLIPWRSLSGGTTPDDQNVQMCLPFLMKQIELVKPKLILALDGLVAKKLTGQNGSIMNLRGKLHEIDVAGAKYDLIATHHPKFLLDNPAYKQAVWHDMLLAQKTLSQSS